ncbi:hypothetical protein [Mucilaginibacter paludis]|uniref:Uncharacterized protein n=1 Tax=Mucilaginibacter paludis DSM 18603 TaxID=714943 RepID=H1Y451_9SPHI|nr:hypothetical protein [Mucilaginibacter paludis]EHQ24787.1 hypothetical protein Mucpa_0596 [Mucilaginibacter paludis DSM 18603]
MEDTIYLLVKVRIKTSYPNIHDAIAELQTETVYSVSSTENVEVTATELIQLKTKK